MGARTLIIAVTRDSTERSMRAASPSAASPTGADSHCAPGCSAHPSAWSPARPPRSSGAIGGGPGCPPGRKISAAECGVGGAPTLLSNAETYAQLAIAARIGARRYGTPGCPTSPAPSCSPSPAPSPRPMVIEVPTGVPLRYVLQLAGAPPLPQGVLTGGYHGNWIDATAAHEAIVSRDSLEAAGGALGAGAILPIGPGDLPARRVAADRAAGWPPRPPASAAPASWACPPRPAAWPTCSTAAAPPPWRRCAR